MIFARLHPLLVHFPVALLVSGILFELFGRLRHEPAVETAGRFNLRLGFGFTLLAMVVGLLGLWNLEVKDSARAFVGYHLISAVTTALLIGTALVLNRFRRSSWVRALYVLFLIAGLCATLTTGYFGGELVHRFGVSTPHPVD